MDIGKDKSLEWDKYLNEIESRKEEIKTEEKSLDDFSRIIRKYSSTVPHKSDKVSDDDFFKIVYRNKLNEFQKGTQQVEPIRQPQVSNLAHFLSDKKDEEILQSETADFKSEVKVVLRRLALSSILCFVIVYLIYTYVLV